VVVQAVDDAKPLVSHLPDVARSPASVMKVVTTWSALEYLGPAFTWPTEVYFLGPFDGHKLDGDLAIKGYGDPYLVVEEVWKLLRSLRRMGLTEITGDLVLDDSHFRVDEPEPGAFDGQPYRTYNVVPNALLMNFKAVQFQFMADAQRARVIVATEPELANLKVDNNLTLVDGPCRGFQAGISFNHADLESLERVVLDGQFSRRCNVYGLARTVLQHDTFAYGLFSSLWKEVGGSFSGKLRKAQVPADATPAFTWQSKPLGEVVRSINKNSNNVMTRQLVYTLGAEAAGAPGTRANGIAAIRELLASRGLSIDSLMLQNGAGLSRDERASMQLLVDILRAAYRSPYGPEFIASLSLGGLDGTTRSRFDASMPAAGVMHLKTGRLDHVSAVAGYVRGANEKTYVVAVVMNSEDAHRGPGQELEEAVLRYTLSLR
ncbi:MAG TPA: D-alanyl-D-alanine carboxypeptidase/D-alanyl-D-alanine-endopeptidase, partial [Gammaproteobacteria bacterium]|nr:D-alanyl-D-alanine carboxypeptidase/D-alanyl-D-alanine-endopeptidase [Gammaproteobacteria bacterium]